MLMCWCYDPMDPMIQWIRVLRRSEMTKCWNLICTICTCNMVRWQIEQAVRFTAVVMLRSINWLINVHRHYVDREGLTTSLSSQHQQQSKQDIESFYLLTEALALWCVQQSSSRDSSESAVNCQTVSLWLWLTLQVLQHRAFV